MEKANIPSALANVAFLLFFMGKDVMLMFVVFVKVLLSKEKSLGKERELLLFLSPSRNLIDTHRCTVI